MSTTEEEIKSFHLTHYVPKDFTGKCNITGIGETRYYLNGKIHREGGPAVFTHGGDREWYYHGQLHRLDGPAVQGPGGWFDDGNEWWVFGEQFFSEEEFLQNRYVIEYKIKKKLNDIETNTSV